MNSGKLDELARELDSIKVTIEDFHQRSRSSVNERRTGVSIRRYSRRNGLTRSRAGLTTSSDGDKFGAQKQDKVDIFLNLQDEDFIRSVFNKFVDSDDLKMSANGLRSSLVELRVPYMATAAAELVKSDGLSFQEFRALLTRQPTDLEKWIATLPLSGLLSECIGIQEKDELLQFSRLSEDRIDKAIRLVSYGLRRVLAGGQAKLRRVFCTMDEKKKQLGDGSAPKFQTFKMSTGNVAHYFEGLSGRVGESLFK